MDRRKVTLTRGLVKHPGHPDLPIIMRGRLKLTYGIKAKVEATQEADIPFEP